MGNHYIIKEETLTNIADSIREKLGTEDSYSPDNMANGVDEVYEAGKTKGQNDIWNMVTNNRKRTTYERAFQNWGNEYLRPPFKIVPTTGSPTTMFSNMLNLKKIEKAYFDLSQLTPSQTNRDSGCATIWNGDVKLEEIEDIGLPAGYYYYTWNNCEKLRKIELIRSVETTVYGSNAFHGCRSLTNIAFDGVIGKNISFASSPLNVASMKNIIEHLKNYSGITDDNENSLEYSQTLTLKSLCVTELEAADFTDEDKEWLAENGMEYTDSLTWITVIDNLKWNLVSA